MDIFDRFAGLLPQLAHFTGTTALARGLQRNCGCLLTFHRVASPGLWEGLPNRGFHIDADFLSGLLDYLLKAGWAVVSMDEAVSRMDCGDQRPFVNFSIDDVYSDTAKVAVPIFRRRNLPVTLFVTTGIPDRTMCLWSAGLETILHERAEVELEDGSVADLRSTALKRRLFAYLSAAWEPDAPGTRYQRFCDLNGFSMDVLHDRHAMTWEALRTLAREPGVEIGGHTISHTRISSLSESGAWLEIAGCRERLQDQLKVPIRHFAFPFGRRRDCGARDFALARRAGFVTAATTTKGLVGPTNMDRLHSLPRNTLNGEHRCTAQVELHLSGLGGLIARAIGAT